MDKFITKRIFEEGMRNIRRANKEKFEHLEDYPSETMEDVLKTGITYAMAQEFVSADPASLTCEMRFPVREWQLNPNGTMHGGMIATAFDNALGSVVVFSHPDSHITTISQSVSYLKPVRFGENFLIRVRCVSTGRSVMTLTGEGYAEETGELCAIATSVYRILPKLEGQPC